MGNQLFDEAPSGIETLQTPNNKLKKFCKPVDDRKNSYLPKRLERKILSREIEKYRWEMTTDRVIK